MATDTVETDYERFIDWAEDNSYWDLNYSDYYNSDDVKEKLKDILNKIKSEATTNNKDKVEALKKAWVNNRTSASGRYWKDVEDIVAVNVFDKIEEIKKNVREGKDYDIPSGFDEEMKETIEEEVFQIKEKEIQDSSFDDVFIPSGLSESKIVQLNKLKEEKIGIEREEVRVKKVKEEKSKEIKKSVVSKKINLKTLKMREREALASGVLSPELKSIIREREREIIGTERERLENDIQSEFINSRNIGDLEMVKKLLEENRSNVSERFASSFERQIEGRIEAIEKGTFGEG